MEALVLAELLYIVTLGSGGIYKRLRVSSEIHVSLRDSNLEILTCEFKINSSTSMDSSMDSPDSPLEYL